MTIIPFEDPKDKEYWYRADSRRYAAPLDEFDSPIGTGTLEVRVTKWEVLKHTPKGVWIREGTNPRGRFILREASKRFACPTIREAMESFVARKNRQIKIKQAEIRDATEAKERAEQWLSNEAPNFDREGFKAIIL